MLGNDRRGPVRDYAGHYRFYSVGHCFNHSHLFSEHQEVKRERYHRIEEDTDSEQDGDSGECRHKYTCDVEDKRDTVDDGVYRYRLHEHQVGSTASVEDAVDYVVERKGDIER